MARGHENLIPFAERTEEEQRKIRSKGGKESGKSRRAKRDAREVAKAFLDCLASGANAKRIASIFPCFSTGEIDNRILLLAKKFENAMKGKSNDIDGFLELAGEGPIKQQHIDHTSSDGSMSPTITPEQRAERFGAMLKQLRERDSADA